ncbi:MAG TPA: selenoneine synthase SenA [Limnobacter sp.]|uniref:selenoneine synthase SenA n=1 Tax=Limnobacter sp. TaxID=2003368 RepID=UPI002E308D09|nr:selenoneine synthase SenA [Limnobacter sp.]HEX5486469.1 selenoneine synthase SenA [Limnobacter sp.]
MNDQATLLKTLNETHDLVLSMLEGLTDEQLNVPCVPGINPPLWEVGHAAFFYERFVLQWLDGGTTYNPAMDEIWDSFELAHEDRWLPGLFPDQQETLTYFSEVYRRVAARIQAKPLTDQAHYLVKYAIFHQHMHLESMTWCRQTLAYSPSPGAVMPAQATHHDKLGDVQVPGGVYRFGMPANSPDFATTGFCFDNEKPGFSREIAPFSVSATLVSNAEFLDFVLAGGYQNDLFWSMGGLRWRDRNKARNSAYWRQVDGQWQEKHFDRWLTLQPEFAVRHVSFWEAQAYCKFAGRRLPTELEWEAAALGNLEGRSFRLFPWGDTMDSNRVDMDRKQLGRLPVSALPEGASPWGCRQMIGTVWEWTADQFMPYDGFCMDMYPFMSTLQFGDHKVVRGGSCATSSLLIRGTYRQAYLPDRNDVFVGFRTCAI